MLFIFIAALFSVAVSVLLKIYKNKQLDIFQILAFNYVTASGLAYLWFKPEFSVLSWSTPWWLIGLLAILLPLVFWFLHQSLTHAGLIKTEIAQRISVVLTILISALIYQEHFTTLKFIGIALGFLAVICMLLGKSTRQEHQISSHLMWRSLLAVWVGYAVIDLLFKYLSTQGMQFSVSLTLIFILAAILMLAVNVLKKAQWHQHSIIAGVVLGILNFSNIAFYLYAHKLLKDSPAIVFASMNILVVVFGVIAAIVIFKEKLNSSKIVGGILAIVAVYCLMQSML